MSLIQKTYKSTDTEEWFDIIFNRPLGYLWARLFNHSGVHPNTVTCLPIILVHHQRFLAQPPRRHPFRLGRHL